MMEDFIESTPETRAEFASRAIKARDQNPHWRPDAWPDMTRITMYRKMRGSAPYVLAYWRGHTIRARTQSGAAMGLKDRGCGDLRWVLRDGWTDREIASGESVYALARTAILARAKKDYAARTFACQV